MFDLQDAEGFWRPVPGSGSSCWFQAEFMAAEMMMDLFAGLPRLAPDGSINDDLELAVWLFPDHGPVRGRKCLGCARAGGTTMQESTASTRTKACAPLQRRPQCPLGQRTSSSKSHPSVSFEHPRCMYTPTALP